VLGSEPGCFDSSSVEIARLLADLATVALDGTTRAEQLSEAVENRDLIGQAKGILMACFAISPDEAFARLVRRSQAEHVKLHEICRRVVRQIQACPEAGGTSPRS
jgi:AmiR/NasT family two-component response regulator